MLTIVTGPAKAGKSRYIFDCIGKLAREGKPSLLIVPESYSHQAERGLLAACGNAVGRYASVTSFSKLARDILADTGAGARFLEDSGRVLYMHGALADAQSQLRYFRSTQKPRLISKLLEAVDELTACRITPAGLLEAVSADRLPPKIYDLAMIYAAFHARIQRGGLDSRNPFDVACGLINKAQWLRDAHVFIDGFSGFTAQRRHAIGRMLEACQSVTVSLLLGGDPVLFAQQEKTKSQLVRLAADSGAQVTFRGPPGEETQPLDKLARGIFDYGVKAADADPSAVQVYSCGSPAEECRLSAAIARQLLVGEGIRARQIAVVCTDMDGYASGLEAEFARFDVPIFISHAEDILSKPPIRAFVGALSAVEGGLSPESVIDWLKSGLSGMEADSCHKLENYALTWNIRGGRWLRPFTAHTSGFGNPAADEADRLAEVEAARQLVIEPLEWLSQAAKSCKLGSDFARVCRLHLERTAFAARLEERVIHLEEQGRPRPALQYAQIFDIIDKALDQFEGAVGMQAMSLRDFIRLLELTLSQYSVDTIPASLDAVQACTFQRFPTDGIDYLIILGGRDGLLPSQPKGEGLLSESERITLEGAGIVLTQTAEEMALEEQSYIYRAIASVKNVVFTWPTVGAGGEKYTQSHILRRVKTLAVADEIPAAKALHLLELTAKAPAMEVACTALSAADSRSAAAREYLRGENDANAFFDSLSLWANRPSGAITDKKLVRDLYGSVLHMTATRIEKIASCRFSYFMDYGLKVKTRKKAQLGPPEIGTLVHDVVENAIRYLCQNGGGNLEAAVASQIESSVVRLLRGKETTARLRGLMEMLSENISLIVANIWEEICQSSFKPLFFELNFDAKGDLPPLYIQVGDMKASIGGKIDRVDGWADDETLYLKVVDYKTGEKSFKLSDVYYGLNLQMFLYLSMLGAGGEERALVKAQQVFGAKPGKLGFGGALYIPAKAPWVQASADDHIHSIQGAIDKELRRLGIVNSDMRVLEALEPMADKSFRFLPVSIKKDGGFTAYSSVASSHQLGSLVWHTQQMVKELASCIAGGDIAANPYRKGLSFSACDWCDFRTACYFEPESKNAGYRYLPPLKDSEVFEKLATEEMEAK